MGSLIKRKREKILELFSCYGYDIEEDVFIAAFKLKYPTDWELIQKKWNEEVSQTPLGKKHPMKSPDVYMKEMYRNWHNRYGYLNSFVE